MEGDPVRGKTPVLFPERVLAARFRAGQRLGGVREMTEPVVKWAGCHWQKAMLVWLT